MEWVEAQGKSVDDAIEAALTELRISSRDEATIEVLQEPKGGFLGMGSQDAVVKVTPKPKKRRRRRRRKPGSGEQQRSGQKQGGSQQRSPRNGSKKKKSSSRGSNSSRSKQQQKKTTKPTSAPKEAAVAESKEPAVTVEEQGDVAKEFLEGLLGAFGLEGTVETKVDDDVLFIDVSGDQTEALVGAKGAIMQSVLELTRTVIQRKTYGAPRMRIDIAGYGERRREALKIYTGKLVTKVLDEKVEVMLEPMNPADRKVVHDAVGEHDGVRSFSEGEDPHRSVVISLDES